jgi:hypothetical protein
MKPMLSIESVPPPVSPTTGVVIVKLQVFSGLRDLMPQEISEPSSLISFDLFIPSVV